MVSHDNDLYLEFYVILLLSAGLESKKHKISTQNIYVLSM
jgi:hypothetical protein